VMLAEHMGMCNGMRKAVKLAEETAEMYRGNGGVYMLGPIAHNPHVMAYFKEKGVVKVDSIDEIRAEAGTVIIRAHGVPDSVKKSAAERGMNVVDATCNLVLRSKDIAKMLENEKYKVVIYGEKKHPEIIGIAGNLADPLIIEDLDQARSLSLYKTMGLIAQTTSMPEKYAEIQKELRAHCECLRIEDTICMATQNRQDSGRKTAERAELMLVVGDASSSNSMNLLKACKEVNEYTFMVSDASGLKPNYFKGIKKIGLTASASSPEWVINGIVNALRGM